jgi:hypothetical protein
MGKQSLCVKIKPCDNPEDASKEAIAKGIKLQNMQRLQKVHNATRLQKLSMKITCEVLKWDLGLCTLI